MACARSKPETRPGRAVTDLEVHDAIVADDRIQVLAGAEAWVFDDELSMRRRIQDPDRPSAGRPPAERGGRSIQREPHGWLVFARPRRRIAATDPGARLARVREHPDGGQGPKARASAPVGGAAVDHVPTWLENAVSVGPWLAHLGPEGRRSEIYLRIPPVDEGRSPRQLRRVIRCNPPLGGPNEYD